MKVFISWSGERSQVLAQALRDWLPMVLYYVEPWLSHSDIDAGERWALEVAKELEASKFGIICITRENIASPWILFEAGALAKFMQEGRVIPLLLDIEFKDITGPLAQFQAKKVEKGGLLDVVSSVNQISETKVPDTRLTPLFETLWPTLEKKVADIPKTQLPAKQNRPQHEILEELVTGVRDLSIRFRDSVDEFPRGRRRKSRFYPMMVEEVLHTTKLGPRDPLRFLVLASFLKDDLPWLYELGVEAYREALHRGTKTKEAQHRFLAAFKALRRGPILEMLGDKENFIIMDMIEHFLSREASIDDDNEKIIKGGELK
jgi:hypothetical protein